MPTRMSLQLIGQGDDEHIRGQGVNKTTRRVQVAVAHGVSGGDERFDVGWLL